MSGSWRYLVLPHGMLIWFQGILPSQLDSFWKYCLLTVLPLPVDSVWDRLQAGT